VRQKIQSSRDGPIVPVDLELSSASDYGGGRHWRAARSSNDIDAGVSAGGAFAGVPDDFDHRLGVSFAAEVLCCIFLTTARFMTLARSGGDSLIFDTSRELE
jgi:hypothetical protein